MIALLIMVFLTILILEVPGLVRKKMWRELTAFSVLLVLGMALSIPQALGMTIPNPNTYVETVFKPFVQWLQK